MLKSLKISLKKSAEVTNELTRSEMEFLPAAMEIVETPPSPIGRATVWVLIALFAIALVWSCIGQVDEVAVAPGKVIPSGYTKTIQAEDKGVVKRINVKDGSKVQAGDLLIELDTTFTAADLARLVKEQAYYQLEIKRLVAEQRDQPFIPDQDPNVNPQDLQYQRQLYHSRIAEYRAKTATAQQGIYQAQAALDIAQSTKQKLVMQLEIATDKEGKMQGLVEQGAVSQFQYQDYKERRITLQQDHASQVSEIVKANHALLQSMESLNNT
jgi:hemolysin D